MNAGVLPAFVRLTADAGALRRAAVVLLAHMPRWLRRCAQVLTIALAYWLAGRLGLNLAIPPGYATAVWPASGIALAAVVLLGWRAGFGVVLGSFLVNVGNGFSAESPALLLRSLGVPLLIAAGSTAQALLGAWLIQRHVGYRNLLTQELEVALMLLLGGPLACLVSASVGVTVLWSIGAIPSEAYLSSWGTWWVGDSIGVLIFTPLVLVWSLPPDRLWRGRQIWATLPLVALFALVVVIFVQASQREAQAIGQRLQADAEEFASRLRSEAAQTAGAVQSLRGLFESSDTVTLAEFQKFAALTQEQAPGLLFLSWAPLVLHEQRAHFEASEDVTIHDIPQAAAPSPLPAAARDRYAPVMAISARYADLADRGYDLYSEPLRAQTLARVVDGLQPVISEPLQLVQDLGDRRGLLIMVPVQSEQAGSLRGFVIGALRAHEMLALPLKRLEAAGIRVRLSASPGASPVYTSAGWREPAARDLGWQKSVEVLGRRWQVQAMLPAEYLVSHRSLAAWTVLTAGMLFTGLFGIFVLVIIGRTSRIAQLVDERTADLAREIERANQLEHAARRQAEKLAASNRDLEQFAYVASHDLQAPLRTIASFAGLLESRYSRVLDVKGQDFLEAIVDGAQEMKSRINDLLQLSRVNAERAEMAPVHLDDVLQSVCRQLQKDIDDTGARIVSGPLPQVLGDRQLLEQLFQNLIGNAIKFQKGGQKPHVEIGAEPRGGTWRVTVRDNGIGISRNSMQEMFVMFRRLPTAEKYSGTGIGLAVCKKIVDLHHGRIEVESQVGQGAAFIITLPMKAASAGI